MVNKKDYSIYLRAFEPEDYLQINKWRNDADLQKLTCGTFRYVSTEMEKAWTHDKMLNNNKGIYWAICSNDGSDKMIGYTSINEIDYLNRSVNGGGVVIGDNEYRDGQALVEVLYIKLDYVFCELNMNRYYARCLASHTMSRSLMGSYFMNCEGVEKEAVYKCGKYHDVCRYSLLRKEFFEHKENGDFEVNGVLVRLAKNITLNRKRG